jgi:hypothetical protein
VTETINYPRQEFETWWKCTVCGSDFEYVGVRQEGASLRTHKDRPNFCPECGAEDTAWRRARPINMAVEAVFPTLPEAARTVGMAMDAQLPETWADAKRVPYEDTPLTMREVEALLHVAPYNDGIERLAIQELLDRRKADAAAVNVSMEVNRVPTAWQAFEPRMSMTVGSEPLQPCVVCGARTPVYCLECGAMTHVCLSNDCQRAHARNKHNAAGMATGEWVRSDSVAPTLQTMGEPQTAAEVSAMPRVTNKIDFSDFAYYGPCSVCGAVTSWTCSDCGDTGVSVYICDKSACQRAHERTHKAVQE